MGLTSSLHGGFVVGVLLLAGVVLGQLLLISLMLGGRVSAGWYTLRSSSLGLSSVDFYWLGSASRGAGETRATHPLYRSY